MKHRKIAASALAAVMLIGGCSSENTVGAEEYSKLVEENESLSQHYQDLLADYGELEGENNRESEYIRTITAENDLLRDRITSLEEKLAGYEESVTEYAPVTIHKSSFTLEYLGDETGSDGERIIVLRCQAIPDVPYIMIDTKNSELHSGFYVVERLLEFANESIDENGYLYLLNSESTVNDMYGGIEPAFAYEKYIKLRLKDPYTETAVPYSEEDYSSEGEYTFVGDISVRDVYTDREGNIQDNIYTPDYTLSVLSAAELMRFEEDKYDYNTISLRR
ncbi:MAG TPA: hypothetical protein DDX72_05210 [Ruminococcaceae bacterium]|nr:hypothetical protein [Oscillospiraceae bacterium]